MNGKAAILVIDLLNTFDFTGGEKLKEAVAAMIDPISSLRQQAKDADVPVIFVNDNYGRWHDEPSELVAFVSEGAGGELIEQLKPGGDDYFVIKPESSGFYATTLPALLPRLGVSRLVLIGVAADICVLFTAADAHMREYDLWVPRDLVASQHDERASWALEMMENGMSADTRPTSELTLADWLASEPKVRPGRAA
ncbi:isochorismatase family cysteine hydrolase [Sphingomonas sp. IC4-52]|uniref:isochorismatase family cysteine hydrolase n=1 Tax=Sphingomonas sp. IC4-52 TaxID=2887202 RepID=UPI001D102087|nr:isochorismatase family cysteine hydrolase [Sphingomonas sp. IC4-52]MCC2979338.1 cysteine hydrolase [Sphingomonas sp. IC4-52]